MNKSAPSRIRANMSPPERTAAIDAAVTHLFRISPDALKGKEKGTTTPRQVATVLQMWVGHLSQREIARRYNKTSPSYNTSLSAVQRHYQESPEFIETFDRLLEMLLEPDDEKYIRHKLEIDQ